MATPGKLIETVAKTLGVSESTVTSCYRILREAGLVTKAGRGRGSAKMSSQDAANLLIGVAASSFIKDAAEVVRDYSSLPVHPLFADAPYHRWALAASPVLDTLPFEHTLGQALTGLIQAASDGSLRDVSDRCTPYDFGHFIEVTFSGPRPDVAIDIVTDEFRGKIHYANSPQFNDEDHEDEEVTNALIAIRRFCEEGISRYGDGDLLETRRFFDRTIFAVGEMLKN